jgi:predicted O-methyltransferase YrrM
MPGLITDEDADLIRRVATDLPEGSTVVDLGAGYGGTALAVLSSNPTVKVVSVDRNPDMLAHTRAALEQAGFLDRWEGLEMLSLEAPERFEDASLPLVLLDTSHEYEDTVQEIAAWLPKVRLEGFFWFHDYDAGNSPAPPPAECIALGVKRAVDPVIEQGLLKGIERYGWSLLTQVVAYE